MVVLVLDRGFNSGNVDGRHGGCVGSAQRFQFQGVLMADMVVVLVLH